MNISKSLFHIESAQIDESFQVDDMPEKGKQECELFLGRIQPIHNGHVANIKKMKNPVIVIVKGAKTSLDKAKNPFSAEEQIEWVKAIFPHAVIETALTGYVPGIIADLRKKGYEPSALWAGADRIEGYKKQIASINSKLDDSKTIDLICKEMSRAEGASATAVRAALKSDDKSAFQKLMPKQLWDKFDAMKKTLNEDSIMQFKDFFTGEQLGEDAVATATTVTTNAAGVDMPLGKKNKKVVEPPTTEKKESYFIKKLDVIISEHETLDEALKKWSSLSTKQNTRIYCNDQLIEADQWANLTDGLSRLVDGMKLFDMLELRFQSGIEKMI